MKTQRGVIAVPARDCAPFIAAAIRDLATKLDQDYWLIAVFINPSTDGTLEAANTAALEFPEQVIIFPNKKDYGLGGSFKLAFEFARANSCEYLGFFHGDHQAEAHDMFRLLEKLQSDPSLCALFGSRFSLGSKRKGYSFKRTAANYCLNALASILTGHLIPELGSGCNAFRVEKFDNLLISSLSNEVVFDLELLLLMIERRMKFAFTPIHWNDFGQITTVRDFQVGWRVLKILIGWRLA